MFSNHTNFELSGQIVDLLHNRIYPGRVEIFEGRIRKIRPTATADNQFLVPGLIDAHIHIESSLLTPAEFARLVLTHGTVAALCDPHEIANVLGIPGIRYMMDNGAATPFKFYFGVPSCVPSTPWETSGAVIDASLVEWLFQNYDLKFLGEMMDFPGVIEGRSEVLAKIRVAQKYGKPIDGHAPGLTGARLLQYAAAGITSEHEAADYEEAVSKIEAGMAILIREGSAAKNFDALHPLIASHGDKVMFCSDDKHPDALLNGHLNQLVQRAIRLGYDPLQVLRCASLNPIRHYHLDVGLLQPGDPGDFLVIDDLIQFNVLATFINGVKVAEAGECLFPRVVSEPINHFATRPKQASDFARSQPGPSPIRVIQAIPSQLLTHQQVMIAPHDQGFLATDLQRDLLKLTVINRYQERPPAVALIQNFGLKTGAIASSVAHDSHNLIAVGVNDEALTQAVNAVIQSRGGLAVASPAGIEHLPLPVAGLMSPEDGRQVAKVYTHLARLVREMGSPLPDAFMTLSFMALLVIPELKLSDRGLFDGNIFDYVPLEYHHNGLNPLL